MTENEIGKIVVDAAYRVHSRLGPGLLEKDGLHRIVNGAEDWGMRSR